MSRKKQISNKRWWVDHEPSSQHKKETTYTLEPLESRVLLSADLSSVVQVLPSKAIETPLPAVVLNVPPTPTTGQQTLSVAQLLALPISSFPLKATAPLQNQASMPISDSSALPQIGKSGQSFGQSPTNKLTTPTNTPPTEQHTLPASQILPQPIALLPSAVATSVSETLGQNQSVSQTLAPPLQNQAPVPTSDSSLLPQTGESGQSFGQPPINEPTTSTNTVPPTEQHTLPVAQILPQPISPVPSTVTTSVSETLGQNQSVSQTVTPPLQNQASVPTSDSSLLPQTGESGQSVSQPPTNEPTTSTNTVPITEQQTLSVAQILPQPISLLPSAVTTNSSNATELVTSPPTKPELSGSATTNPAPSDGSVAVPSFSSPMTNIGPAIDPILFNQWQQQMLHFGQQHATSLSGLSGDAALNAIYYDAARVFYQIADYTHDPSWLAPAHEAATIYRDQFVMPNNGDVPGYWNFTGGLLLDYQHTGDVRSKDAIILLSKNAAFAVDGTPLEWSASTVQSREVAYSIMSYLNAETVGQPHRARLDDLVTQAIGHLDQWFVSKTAPYLQPFMAGLTMEALIQYNTAVGGDPRILPAIQSAVDSMWSHNWLPGNQSFQYVDQQLSGVGGPDPAPDLNMLIAPAYAWMYHETGNPMYQQEADAIFKGGVEDAYLQGEKQFNQNYLFAFDFLTWRNS
jgi:hypothetical protein